MHVCQDKKLVNERSILSSPKYGGKNFLLFQYPITIGHGLVFPSILDYSAKRIIKG